MRTVAELLSACGGTECASADRARQLAGLLDHDLSRDERAQVLEALIVQLVTVSRHRAAVDRAGELVSHLRLRAPSRFTVWVWSLVVLALWRPGWRDRVLRALLRVVLWPLGAGRGARAYGQVRAVQFAHFWHNIRRCRSYSLLQLALAGDEAQIRGALAWLGYAHAYAGDGWIGIPLLRRVLLAMHRAGDRAGLTQTYPLLAIVHAMNRQPRRARRCHQLFQAHFAQDPFYRLLSLTNMQGALFGLGEFVALRKLIDRCFTECFALDESRHHLQVYGWHAVLLAAEGRRGEAQQAIATSRRAAERNDNHLDWVIHGRLAALVAILLGDRGEALARVQSALAHCACYGAPRFYQRELEDLAAIASGRAQRARGDQRAAAYEARLFAAGMTYTNRLHDEQEHRVVELTFHSLSAQLSHSLSSACGFDPDREVDDEALAEALKRTFPTSYVAIARDADSLRRKAMQELGIDTLSVVAEGSNEVRLVCAGGGLFVGYPCPRTIEVGEEIAVGILLRDLDIVSESLVKAALRMVLAQYVFVRSIRVSRERYAAEKRVAALGRLTRMFAHDVRQPFTILRVAMDALRNTRSPEEFQGMAAEFLTAVESSVSAVDGLIQDMLEIESSDQPRCEIEAPRSLVRAALNQVVQAHPGAQLRFRYQWWHRHAVRVDGVKVLRVFCNLVTNAVEAMKGRGTIWFRTREVERNGRVEVEFTVGNSGSSIPREDAARIFDPLYTRGKPGGTGLGLAIAQKIVAAHGGQIGCNPNAGDGVEFWLTLPAGPLETVGIEGPPLPVDSDAIVRTFQFLRTHRQESPPEVSEAALVEAFRRKVTELGRRAVVVIVDDEPLYRNWLLGLVLRENGLAEHVTTRAVGSPAEFFAEEAWYDADLFIIDVDLNQDLSGLDLLRRVRARNAEALLTVHSNCAHPDDFRAAAEAGADAFLPKPMSRAHLLHLLKQCCERAAHAEAPTVDRNVSWPEAGGSSGAWGSLGAALLGEHSSAG